MSNVIYGKCQECNRGMLSTVTIEGTEMCNRCHDKWKHSEDVKNLSRRLDMTDMLLSFDDIKTTTILHDKEYYKLILANVGWDSLAVIVKGGEVVEEDFCRGEESWFAVTGFRFMIDFIRSGQVGSGLGYVMERCVVMGPHKPTKKSEFRSYDLE